MIMQTPVQTITLNKDLNEMGSGVENERVGKNFMLVSVIDVTGCLWVTWGVS